MQKDFPVSAWGGEGWRNFLVSTCGDRVAPGGRKIVSRECLFHSQIYKYVCLVFSSINTFMYVSTVQICCTMYSTVYMYEYIFDKKAYAEYRKQKGGA
jgi:hypothetical protein